MNKILKYLLDKLVDKSIIMLYVFIQNCFVITCWISLMILIISNPFIDLLVYHILYSMKYMLAIIISIIIYLACILLVIIVIILKKLIWLGILIINLIPIGIVLYIFIEAMNRIL